MYRMQYYLLQMIVKMPPQILGKLPVPVLAPPTQSPVQEFELLPRRSYTADLLIVYHGHVENSTPDYCQ
jgi:hypothetical protein